MKSVGENFTAPSLVAINQQKGDNHRMLKKKKKGKQLFV